MNKVKLNDLVNDIENQKLKQGDNFIKTNDKNSIVNTPTNFKRTRGNLYFLFFINNDPLIVIGPEWYYYVILSIFTYSSFFVMFIYYLFFFFFYIDISLDIDIDQVFKLIIYISTLPSLPILITLNKKKIDNQIKIKFEFKYIIIK